MSPNQDRTHHQALFAALHGLIESEGEYLSHRTALFLLGQENDPPEILTVVSPRRRRPRTIEGRELVFICLPPEKLKPLQRVAFGELSLPVSTLEKTLLDLVGYLDHAPLLEDLVRIFSTLPFSPSLLINLARQTSDTILKRVAYLLAFTGRVAWDEIPFEAITRTPVKLDNRREGGDSVWDSRFNLRCPAWLLESKIPPGPADAPDEVRNWIELRGFPGFIQTISRERFLPLRGDPSPKSRRWLEEYFASLFAGIPRENLGGFLVHHLDRLYGLRHPRPYPVLLSEWLDADPARFAPHLEFIRIWVGRHAHSDDPIRLEAALFFGRLLGETDTVLEILAGHGLDLLAAGRDRVVVQIADEFAAADHPLPTMVFIVMSRSFARRGRYSQALETLERGKELAEDLGRPPSDLGELAHSAGLLLGRMGRYDAAHGEMLLARECFAIDRNFRGQGMVEFGTGNLYFARGMTAQARASYLVALATLRVHGTREQQANLLGNLGMVESDAGAFRKAVGYFTRMIELPQRGGNAWGKSIIMLARAKAWLQMGLLTKALKGFQETFQWKQRLDHAIGVCEAAAMLSWTCEILGQDGAAQAWWKIAEDEKVLGNEPRALYLLKNIRAMSALFRNDLETALERYRDVLRYVDDAGLSAMARSNALHGLGCCLSLLERSEASEVLAEARGCLGKTGMRPPALLLSIFCGVHHPRIFPDIDLTRTIDAFLESQSYDPFWAWSAGRMIGNPLPAFARFLEWHCRRTPPSTLKILATRIPGFGELLGKLRKGPQRAAEFLTRVGPQGAFPIHLEDYEVWRKERSRSTFRFDGNQGVLLFADRSIEARPGSLSHGILSHLLMAWPHPVDVETLFRTVWGTAFDPEIDPAAIKSAFARLRRLLRSVCPGAAIRRKAVKGTVGALGISFSCPWEAIL